MSEEALNFISDLMVSLDVPYNFMEWKGEVPKTYFVGEYQETPTLTKEENGYHETAFILTGTTRDLWLSLEQTKTKIEEALPRQAIVEGSAVAVFFENAFPVRTGDPELKRIQINLTIKEWRVK